VGYIHASAQAADNRTPMFGRRDNSEDFSKAFKETREKMRIEKETREYDEMLERGQEVHKLADQLGASFAKNGRFLDDDRAALESIEKTAKKIRNQLGGDDDDENLEDLSLADAVKGLAAAASALVDELNKTTRFSVSATAIQSSNSVIRLARFLRARN